MSFKFNVMEQAAQPTVSIRTRCAVGDLPQVLGSAYNSIIAYLNEIGVPPSGVPFVGYFNMDMQDLDIEAGFPVAQLVDGGKGDIKVSEIPAGKTVACIYTGSYSQIEPAYTAMMEWIPANGHTWNGVCYEFYLNDPADTPENELQTNIVCYLK